MEDDYEDMLEIEDDRDFDDDSEEWDDEVIDPDVDEMGYYIGDRVVSADFGLVEVEDEDHGSWLRQRERESVTRTCQVCEQPRTMHRDYAICGRCADMAERGYQF